MYVGIGVEIFIAHGIKHTQWLLCCSRIVEIYEWAVVDGARQYWEVLANFIDIVHLYIS